MKNRMFRGRKQWIKDLLLTTSERIDRLCHVEGQLIPPRTLTSQYGDGSHAEIGLEFLKHLLDHTGLTRESHVLDVGCGVGRIALPLTAYLSSKGSYDGFDIMPEGIDYCARVLTPRFDNFRFKLADVYNSYYNPAGSAQPEEYTFDYPDDTFDVVVSTSVFTHLRPPAIARYVRETARVLKKGGQSFHTCFLLNPTSLAAISAGRDTYAFTHEVDGFRTSNLRFVEAAIAIDEREMARFHAQSELALSAVHHGNWSAPGETRVTHQDICIATKR